MVNALSAIPMFDRRPSFEFATNAALEITKINVLSVVERYVFLCVTLDEYFTEFLDRRGFRTLFIALSVQG
jgi:hypothetical protein